MWGLRRPAARSRLRLLQPAVVCSPARCSLAAPFSRRRSGRSGCAYACRRTIAGVGLACGTSAVALGTQVHADDDLSEPFGGSAARTVGLAALVASGAAWITYDLLQAASTRQAKNAAPTGGLLDDAAATVVTREQLDEGYTGVARYESKQGWTYVGDWKEGKRQGHGTLVRGNLKITGTWHGNALHGEGVMELGSGDRYEGQFENGQLGPVGQVCASSSPTSVPRASPTGQNIFEFG
eukprot:COSAG02_NODE_6563_length_3493_cov_2.258986_1_plen_238_part_00